MDNQTMLSKTIGLQKTAFNNTLTIFSTMQQHGEDLLKTTLEQSPWLPKNSKNACLYWADFYSKYLDNLKSVTNQGFAEIERISTPSSKPVNNEAQPKVAAEPIPTPRPAKKSPAVREKTASTKKTVVANTLPDKKSVTQDTPVKKPIIQNIVTEKLLTHEKPKEKKPAEIKAAHPGPKPSATKQPTSVQHVEDKNPAKKPF